MHPTTRARSFLLSVALPLTISSALVAQDLRAPSACNTTNIRWVLPGDFATAQKRAITEQRMLLVKGISFGVDQAGATCATKGKW